MVEVGRAFLFFALSESSGCCSTGTGLNSINSAAFVRRTQGTSIFLRREYAGQHLCL